MNENTVGDYPVGSVGTLPVDIFKKSEYEKVIDELKELKKKLDKVLLPVEVPSEIGLPYCPPMYPGYNPCDHCPPWRGCICCPYRYDPNWNRFYPRPMYWEYIDPYPWSTGYVYPDMQVTVGDTCLL